MSENKKKLPFKVIRSNVSGGYSDTLHQQFTGGVDLVNYHKDTYGEFQDNPLQSPFTEQWVGGHQFRHININEGNDNASNRPEGWHIQLDNLDEVTVSEDFSSYSTNDTAITGFIGDGVSSVRTRVADNPGKKYFVLRGNPVGSRFLQTENLNEITEITYTFIVYVQNFITYDFNVSDPDYGLALEDPDDGENLVLQYSYDGTTWTNKKTIFLGSNTSSPTLKEITETVDLSAENPKYVRFLQTAYTSAESPGDNYGITDISIKTQQASQNPKINVYSHGYLNSPPAYLTRDGLAKRPVNTRNIKGANSPIGNFFHNYEVVQTSGRRITNNLIVDGFIAGGELTTQFITGSHNYSLPVLNSVTGSKSVIVERFNAPGSKEESSRGALDREGEEMSPNISLPWRNYKVRKPFYSQLSQSTPQGGGSIHGVNRNTVVRAGNTLVDNGFLVRSLPGTDIQYSWITASSITSASELGGYQSFNGSYGLGEAYSDIDFISGSYVFVDGQEEFVDNYGLYSFVKDKKSIDLDTKTLSITEVGTSASYGEITNSPYTFTTWTSIRTGETLVARALRKNNIVSYQDPNNQQVSRNYTDPAVTFKYKPLITKVSLKDAPDGYTHSIKHTYTNNQSTFANKDLITNFEMPEDKQDMYDLLLNLYTNLQLENNPISNYNGYSYKEVVWPREEFTGLDETRKRKAYYLDRPGYDRDGFDRQLGTQRAFWRNNQEDRRRSLNSVGGYSSSFGYISTEESGSSFSVNGSTILLDDSEYIYTSSFSQSTNLDSGIFNSISLMEYTPSETLLFTSSFEVLSASSDPLIYADEQINVSFKRGYRFDVSGELNHAFVDFYGLSKISGSNILRDLGSVYRNSLYKSQLTTKQYDFGSIQDNQDTVSIIKTEDDEIKLNPKLRYTAFVGGGELNASTYVQENFRDTVDGLITRYNIDSLLTSSYTSSNPEFGFDSYITTNGLYIVSAPLENSGSYTELGSTYFFKSSSSGLQQVNIYPPTIDLIADQDKWFGYSVSSNNTGTKIAIGMPHSSGSHVTNYQNRGRIYIYSSSSSGLNLVQTLISSNTFISASEYGFGTNVIMNAIGNAMVTNTTTLGGIFGGPLSLERVFYIQSGSSGFSTVYTVTGSDGNLRFDFSENKIIVSDTGNIVKIYKINTSPVSFTEEVINTSSLSLVSGDEFGNSININTISTDKIAVIGAPYKDYNSIANSGVVYLFKSGSTEWEPIVEIFPNDAKLNGLFGTSVKINANNTTLIVGAADNELYIFESGSLGWKQKQKLKGSVANLPVAFGIDDLLIGDTENYISTAYLYKKVSEFSYYIPENLFSETFTESDILFSTLDNGLQRTTEIDSGKKPFFDNYDDYISDVRGLSKEYSVLPEFKISDHVRYYVNAESFQARNRASFILDGVSGSYQSANSEIDSIDETFYKTYLTSDLLKKHDEIRSENIEDSQFDEINIKLSGIKKLLPYNGFYPQDRITQIANLYEEYVDSNLAGGVLNVSYEDSQRELALIENHAESNASLSTINASSITEFDGKYYIAIGYHYYNSSQGLVKIFSSSTGELLDDSNWSQASVATYTGDTTGVNFGNSVKLLSGSNGLNLFVSQYGTLGDGAVYQITSSDGISWSSKIRISSSVTEFLSSSANSAFGNAIDAIYDENDSRFVLAVAAYIDSSFAPNAGQIYTITSSDGFSWTSKVSVAAGGVSNGYNGTSISIYSGSLFGNNGYILYASAQGNSSLTGSVSAFISTNGATSWSYSGLNVTASQINSGIGLGGISALEYDSKTYLFFSEPYSDTNSLTNNGSMYVYLSGSTGEQKIKLADGLYSNDQLTRVFTKYNTISAVSSSDGFLYYSFSAINANTDTISDAGRVYLGKSNDGIQFETGNDLKQITGPSNNTYLGGSIQTIMSGTTPVYIYTDKVSIYGSTTGKQLSLNLIVSGSEVEKVWKHAAIEPLFGPGIMYNTIKSGLSVDWPCATGSTAVTILDNGVAVNPFYPQPKVMASFQSENGFYNLQGSIKSRINYRIPFEYILNPRNMFAEKTAQLENIKETYKVGSQILTSSVISEFISGTYIYGGYEPYVNPSDVNDIYGQTAKRFSIPFVYQKEDVLDNTLYTRAMNNFLAESVNFFLDQQKLTTFVSKPSSEWGLFEANKTYFMDVKLGKSSNLVMMEAWHTDKHPVGNNGEKMNGRYFGYPVNKTTKDILTGEEFTEEERRLIFNDPAYAPYTPPYFEGEAIARLSVTTEVDEFLTPEELFNRLTVTDIFRKASIGWENNSDAQINKMPVGSSIDLFGSALASQVTVTRTDLFGKPVQIQDTRTEQAGKFWIISPRFETPVLDFSSQQFVSSSNNYLKTSGFGRGMWSGYGQEPSADKGLYLKLSYPFPQNKRLPYQYGTQSNRYDLLEKVGFKQESKKIGRIAEEKTISEAVVLIPYYDNALSAGTESLTIYKEFLSKYLFKINKDIYNLQKDNIDNGRKAVLSGQLGFRIDVEKTSITDMITRAKNYVLPPELDFINNENIDPFVMYIFEVKHKLSKQDLIDIWQGLMPEISRTAQLTGQQTDLPDVDFISHKSGISEFFHGLPIPDNIKWMVFKVKQKGEFDYSRITESSKDDDDFRTSLNIAQEELNYSYNWPYDFFSLIELGKIEIDLKYKKRVPILRQIGGI